MNWGLYTFERHVHGKTVYTVSGDHRGNVVEVCTKTGGPRVRVRWPGLGGITHVYTLDQLLLRGDGHLQLKA